MRPKDTKCLPFAAEFKTLGLEINTQEFQKGLVRVGHTLSRKEELHAQLQGFLDSDAISAKDAERLRGRMIFFEGYTFGRVANSAVKALGKLCTGPAKKRPLGESMQRTFNFL